MGSALSHLGGGGLHRAHDLVVAGAAAEIAREAEADLALGRVRIVVEQRLRRDQEARRADAALECCEFQEFLLERMQLVSVGDALDCADVAALGLGAQHQAGADDATVERHGAGAAIAGAAALLAAGEAEAVAQHVEQGLVDLAEIRDRVAVDGGGNLDLGHQFPLARLSAISAVRRASTPATLMRNSLVPRLSSIGRQAAEAASASRSSAFESTEVPISAFAASGTRITRSATAPSDTRAAVQTPLVSRVRLTPQPT